MEEQATGSQDNEMRLNKLTQRLKSLTVNYSNKQESKNKES